MRPSFPAVAINTQHRLRATVCGAQQASVLGMLVCGQLYGTPVLQSKQSGVEAIPGRIRPRCQHLHRGRPARAFPFQLSNRTEIGMKLTGSRQLLQRQVPTAMMNVMRCFSQSLMDWRPVCSARLRILFIPRWAVVGTLQSPVCVTFHKTRHKPPERARTAARTFAFHFRGRGRSLPVCELPNFLLLLSRPGSEVGQGVEPAGRGDYLAGVGQEPNLLVISETALLHHACVEGCEAGDSDHALLPPHAGGGDGGGGGLASSADGVEYAGGP